MQFRPGNKTKALIVDLNATTFADTLRAFKQDITEGQEYKDIKNIRKTASGKTLITVKKGEKDIKKMVGNALQGRSVRFVGSRKTVIHIRDIDEVASIEVAQAIKRIVRDETAFKVASLRSTFAGDQTVTILLAEGDADRLLARRKIRLGFSNCRL